MNKCVEHRHWLFITFLLLLLRPSLRHYSILLLMPKRQKSGTAEQQNDDHMRPLLVKRGDC